jgi:hypothetical protein
VDLREQVLIALFGNGVLNTEFGGKDVIVLTGKDQAIFDTLRTDTVGRLVQLRSCSKDVEKDLSKYAQLAREYAQGNPGTSKGQAKHIFTKKTEEMLVSQGTPRVLLDGSAVLVSIGSDIGDTHAHDDQPFFRSGGRTAEVVSEVYNHFAHWEAGTLNASFNPSRTKELADISCLPFVDVFPWFVKQDADYEAASRSIAMYIATVKPFIVLAYGSLVCRIFLLSLSIANVVTGNFRS